MIWAMKVRRNIILSKVPRAALVWGAQASGHIYAAQ